MKKKIITTVCMAMTVLTGLAQSPLSFHAKAANRYLPFSWKTLQ